MSRLLVAIAALLAASPAAARELRVCADPNNLPFSNAREEGFENRIAHIIAAELGAELRFVWWAQRRGSLRETLNAGLCDLVPGVASSVEMLATTRPYYRSAYVAVTRAGEPAIASFDDPRLARARVAVQLIGDDGSNSPPAHSLARRGIVANVRGYPVYGDYASAAPQSPIVDAVARNEVDVAFVWGPTAGWFARREPVALTLTPVEPLIDGPAWPMLFDISMGVRRSEPELRRQVDAALVKRAAEIRAVLRDYGVPLLDGG
jgi:mxaJ protein